MISRPLDIDLSNWREYPYSKWSFQHVRELIPTAAIERPNIESSKPFAKNLQDLGGFKVSYPASDAKSTEATFDQLLEWGHTDSLIILHKGKLIYQWSAPYFNLANPHILFSVSKSLTAMLAGIIERQGIIDSNALVSQYLPDAKNSAYGNCTLRHVLDMSVALDFEENYTDKQSEYIQYRIATGWNPVNQENPGPGLEQFLYSLKQSKSPHGETFLYRSPNSDLLGLALERATDTPIAELFSQFLWKPMGATSNGYITLDRCGLGRTAGGICISIADYARVGQLLIENSGLDGKEILPADWIEDTFNNGDQQAWDRGNYAYRLPYGKYRNKWYQFGDEDGCISARGIHGQQLYINPTRSVVAARLSSQPDPLNEDITESCFAAFNQIARAL